MKQPMLVVGLPSYNEVDNIANITKTVDRGLSEYYPEQDSVIVNVDQSQDNTKEVFLSTTTESEKEYIYSDSKGKGRNLFNLLKYAEQIQDKPVYTVTVDADVTSATPKWIQKFFSAMIEHEADYVTPLYKRNRYEGNTTNHFCYPLLSSLYGCGVRQPIAGDFGISETARKTFLDMEKPPCVDQYGIDYFFSLTAAETNLNISEISLGEKIHKPSFGKMVPMFRQYATMTFFLLSRYNFKNKDITADTLSDTTAIGDYTDKPAKEDIENRRNKAQSLLMAVKKERIYKDTPVSKTLVKETLKSLKVSSEQWVSLLANIVKHVNKQEISADKAEQLGKLVTPFYLLRVLTYFEAIEGESKTSVNNILDKQQKRLQRKLKKKNLV